MTNGDFYAKLSNLIGKIEIQIKNFTELEAEF